MNMRTVVPGGASGRVRALLSLGLVAMLCACVSPAPQLVEADVPPLQVDERIYYPYEVQHLVYSPDLLALDPAMVDFVEQYTGDTYNQRQRLMNLHRSVRGSGVLDLRYDPFAEGSAIETFHRGTANCLSYANLFVALAREAGLDASYQWMEVRPQWSRLGERVAVRLHVNVQVQLRGGEQYMADIDPLSSREIAGTRLISDDDAKALYHSNIAMDALSQKDTANAWLHAVRALQLSPAMSHLWVNLGAIYRQADQHDDAEATYLQALQLDPGERSAMNNLVVLYDVQGRAAERDYWADRVQRHRERNPFYHAWKGDKAGEEEDWAAALEHYETALSLRPEDARLLYSVGILHYKLKDYQAADRYISEAIDHATLVNDKESYRVQLRAVRRELVAES